MPEPDPERMGEVLLSRHSCLSALKNSPKEKRELVNRFDYSRSTLDRVIRDLDEMGLVTNSSGKWALNDAGKCALKSLDNHMEELSKLSDCIPVLYPTLDLNIPCEVMRNAEVYDVRQSSVNTVLRKISNKIGEMEKIQAIIPKIFPGQNEEIFEGILTNPHLQIKIIINNEAFWDLYHTLPNIVSELLNMERHTFFRQEDVSTQYGIWICDYKSTTDVFLLYSPNMG